MASTTSSTLPVSDDARSLHPAIPMHEADETWLARGIRLAIFIERESRLPNHRADADPAERALADWLKRQRLLSKTARLPLRRSRWLDAHVGDWRDPRDVAWHATAVAVGLHVAETGAYPSASAADPDTRRLGTWLRTQRRASAAGRLSDERVRWLELNLPFWLRPEAEGWYTLAGAVEHFATEHGQLPRDRRDGGAEERRLARWLRSQRAAAAEGALDDEFGDWLDETVPGWRDPRRAAWHCSARDCAAFAAEHRRLPSRTSGDTEERRLGGWLATQRRVAARGELELDRVGLLDHALPGWRARGTESWHTQLERAVAFVAAHRRMAGRGRTADLRERRLAAWLSDQRAAAREGRLEPARRRMLDERLPGWADDAGWRAAAVALAGFARTHGRLPAAREADPAARRLARWAQRQRARQSAGRLSDEQTAWLTANVPGWHSPGFGVWLETAERVRAFRSARGRLPTRGAGADPLERSLAVWVNNQRGAQRSGLLQAERAAWLDEHLAEWADTRLASWLTRAHEVEAYLREHHRLPYERSTNARSRELGVWLQTQRRAHRRGVLERNRVGWLDANVPGWAEAGRGGAARVSRTA